MSAYVCRSMSVCACVLVVMWYGGDVVWWMWGRWWCGAAASMWADQYLGSGRRRKGSMPRTFDLAGGSDRRSSWLVLISSDPLKSASVFVCPLIMSYRRFRARIRRAHWHAGAHRAPVLWAEGRRITTTNKITTNHISSCSSSRSSRSALINCCGQPAPTNTMLRSSCLW